LEHDVDLRVATALEKDEGVEIALNAPAIPLRKEKVDALTELAWASGQLSLQQETVAEAVREFNRRNRLQIVIEDAGVADLHLCCIFDASDPETFARTIVGASEDVELVRTGDTLRIVSRRAGSAEPPAPGKPF
jgi:transmembrane sensor